MTEQEAIKLLHNFTIDTSLGIKVVLDTSAFMNICEKALEKQIPKKPILIDYEQYKEKIINAEYLRGGYWCPNCKHMIKSGEYCVDCGQRIDWESDTEGGSI